MKPLGGPGQASLLWEKGSAVPGWHLHLQNMPNGPLSYRANDYREAFLPTHAQVVDTEVATMVRRAVEERARRGPQPPRAPGSGG